MIAPTWPDVAAQLAARLATHATCSDHPETAADPDCSACADRVVYRLWQRKTASTRRVPRAPERVSYPT